MKKLTVSVVGLAMFVGIANAEICKDFDNDFNVIEYECGTSLADAIKAKEAKQKAEEESKRKARAEAERLQREAEAEAERLETERLAAELATQKAKEEAERKVREEEDRVKREQRELERKARAEERKLRREKIINAITFNNVKIFVDAGAQDTGQDYNLKLVGEQIHTSINLFVSMGFWIDIEDYFVFARFGYKRIRIEPESKWQLYPSEIYSADPARISGSGSNLFLDVAAGYKLNKSFDLYAGVGVGFSNVHADVNGHYTIYDGIIHDYYVSENTNGSFVEEKLFMGINYKAGTHMNVFVEPGLYLIDGSTSPGITAGLRFIF